MRLVYLWLGQGLTWPGPLEGRGFGARQLTREKLRALTAGDAVNFNQPGVLRVKERQGALTVYDFWECIGDVDRLFFALLTFIFVVCPLFFYFLKNFISSACRSPEGLYTSYV